jgi:hypothetical protein
VFSEIDLRDKIKIRADRQKGPTGPPMFVRVLFSGHLNDHRRVKVRGWPRQQLVRAFTLLTARPQAAHRHTTGTGQHRGAPLLRPASHGDTDPVSVTGMEDLPAALARQAATEAQCPPAAGGRGAAWPPPAAGDRAQSWHDGQPAESIHADRPGIRQSRRHCHPITVQSCDKTGSSSSLPVPVPGQVPEHRHCDRGCELNFKMH